MGCVHVYLNPFLLSFVELRITDEWDGVQLQAVIYYLLSVSVDPRWTLSVRGT